MKMSRRAERILQDVGRKKRIVDEGPHSRARRVEWSEAARIQVLKAVIHVEEEISRENPISFSTRPPMGKWERVANLLPHELGGRVWDKRTQGNTGGYKCSSLFGKLLERYKIMKQKGSKCSFRTLPKPLYELLKKREELLKARTSAVTVQSGSSIGYDEYEGDEEISEQIDKGKSFDSVHHSSESFHESLSPGSNSRRKGTSAIYSRYEEGLRSNLDRPLKRLELEFSHLSKWVQNRSIPFGRSLASELISTSVFHSGKKSKCDSLELGETQRRRINLHISNSFHMLRVEFARELKTIIAEIAEDLLR